MEKDKCTLSNEQLINACRKWISNLCKTKGKCWCLSIPVDHNRDPDMLFNELIDRFKKIYSVSIKDLKEFKK